MTKYSQIIYFFALFNTLFYSQTERMQFEKYITDDGLLLNSISCTSQDAVGFLWIGTEVGLSKYDGYTFTHYYFDPYDSTSLSNPYINTIFESSENQLWIGTVGGLNKYNRQFDSFKRYVSDPNDPKSLSNNIVMCIYEDSKGVIWIGTDGGGLNRFHKNTDSFTSYTHNPNDSLSISNNSIFNSICEDKYGNLLVGTFGGGLNLFNRDTQSFTHYVNDPDNPHSISDNRIYTIYLDKTGSTWVGTEDGLNKVISKEDKFGQLTFIRYEHNLIDPNSISNNRVTSLCEDSNGDLLVGTFDGLNKFKRNQNTFIRYNIKLIQNIYQDITGISWISSMSYGLYKLDNKKQLLKLFRNDPNNPHTLSNNTVYSFLEFNEKVIWVGTRGGLNIFNRESEDFIRFLSDDKNPSSLCDNNIINIYRDRSGDLWIGTMKGLNKVKLDDKNSTPVSFIQYKNDKDNPLSICGNTIISLYEDRLGLLWIGTEHDGISILKRRNNGLFTPSFSHFKHNPQDSNSISSNRVYVILGDRSNKIWIGTINGLDLYNRETNEFKHFKNNPEDPTSLSANFILSIYEDKSGVLWVGTLDGLNKFDKVNNNFKRYTVKNGLPSNTIYTIIEDENGNLWMGTANGLSMLDRVAERFNNYDVNDGLQNNEFNENAALQCSNGELFFGGINGFNVFHPDNLKRQNTHRPKIVITNFMLNHKKVSIGYDTLLSRIILEKSITSTEEIILSYDDENISFEFSALDFTIPKKNQYAYMMEGFEKEWIYTEADKRFATYTNLDPGEYIFKVKGSNNDGVWNEAGTSIKIIILPPWWATTWAYLVYALIIISIIYFTWKLQLKRIRIKQEYEMSTFEAEKLREVDEIKTRFFTNISHEFRTPLTLILGPAKQLLERSQDEKTKEGLDLIHRSAKKLNKLVDELLDISKIESGEMKLNACPQNLVSVVKEIVLSFHSFAERKSITLKFNCDENEIIAYLDKNKVDKILSNILSNAFKFTPEGGKVEVGISRKEKFAEVIITDTGVGIPKAQIDKIFDRFYQVDGSHKKEQEGTGIGLALTKELIDLHKGKIEVESAEGKGSTFRIIFPLGKEHLKPDEICEKEKDKEKTSPEFDEIVGRKDEHKIDFILSDQPEKPSLLIVEDNPDVRKYITGILKSQYNIVEAKDGEEGHNKSFEQIPDLIISDIMMPKMDGFQLCSKLKTDSRTSHIPIIMLTAKATMQDKINGLEIGADDYIMKPFEAEELKARIRNLLEQRKRLHEHFRKYGLAEIEEQNITSFDQKFIQKSIEVVNNNLSNTNLSVEVLASNLAISKWVLNKKLFALTGDTPAEFIKRIRLSKAAKLIEHNTGNISEIALEVGFSNPAYFAECFKKQYGISPSQYHNNSSHS